jgi:hypothetical protein
MKFNEIQAVIQLSIGINIGIYALEDINIQYLTDQRRDLTSLRRLAGEKLETIKFRLRSQYEGRQREAVRKRDGLLTECLA